MKKSVKLTAKSRETMVAAPPTVPQIATSWTFLTNHTHVLLCLYRQSDQRLRDVAMAVGITERMVQRIVAELVEAGYLQITKDGRCNRYTVSSNLRLRHPLEIQHTIGELLALLSSERIRQK
jgi:DNA-binding MarR family transcriptional regulator